MTAVEYLHHTPGRLRIKSRHFHRHERQVRKAMALMQGLPGVLEVRHNPHAGSLTVHYDPERHSQAQLLAMLESAGCLHAGARVQAGPVKHTAAPREGVVDLFGKALVGALAQRTATRLIGALF
ncbi:MAG: heavy-metal-associated domain-containing protein [Anaerolineae bacterium]|nr:heavy-metal-associated domain-containing protein [Anaerolineae bacterium]